MSSKSAFPNRPFAIIEHMNGDGVIGLDDAIIILRIAMGLLS